MPALPALSARLFLPRPRHSSYRSRWAAVRGRGELWRLLRLYSRLPVRRHRSQGL